ncbi:hypothetical protein [Aquimarina litoralis]|uniref:hypothetical protein n=1 Tax=Aquimarina litoralis TaxID=584605 RepID=UPI001C586DAE|nr:hypothetical protein [Aquimarina litoralis]MBW1294043.1 hypothetical protein [Aquimarina litoralis]
MNRLIKVQDIPETLWESNNQKLLLPESLVESWKNILEIRGLLQQATEETRTGEIGGISEEDTHNHYSFRFNGSCARFQLTFLDPKDDLKEVSNAFIKSLAGYDVFIADIPSGTGAASLTLLSNIAQLRKENIIPRLPLSVKILAGEISSTAIEIFQQAFDKIIGTLNSQQIDVELKFQEWNIRDKDSTSQLVKQITLYGNDSSDKILLLANFTGFLEKDKKWDEVKDQFGEIFRHFSGKSTVAIWLEPNMNRVTKNFWPRTKKWFKKTFNKLLGSDEELPIETSEAYYNHGLREAIERTGVAVVKFNTERT